MRPVIVDGTSTQVEHGETAAETGAMLGMNSHALGVRHDLILGEGQRFMREMKRGIDEYLAATGERRAVPLVNLQCDVDHPTQTLADLAWLNERFPGGVRGRRVAVSWAYSPSYAKPLSVPQGLVTLLTRFGARVTLAHPEGYRLTGETLTAAEREARAAGGSFAQVADMDAAFRDAEAVYPKSWGPHDLMLERVEANRTRDTTRMKDIEARALARNAGHRDWICDERRMGLTAGGDALYLHCLPADIGAEVSPGVMERHKLNVARQANKKVYVIMALLAAAKVPDLARRLAGIAP
jgi:ornithine carbamoyltransferase